jgi:hypothetical protein
MLNFILNFFRTSTLIFVNFLIIFACGIVDYRQNMDKSLQTKLYLLLLLLYWKILTNIELILGDKQLQKSSNILNNQKFRYIPLTFLKFLVIFSKNQENPQNLQKYYRGGQIQKFFHTTKKNLNIPLIFPTILNIAKNPKFLKNPNKLKYFLKKSWNFNLLSRHSQYSKNYVKFWWYSQNINKYWIFTKISIWVVTPSRTQQLLQTTSNKKSKNFTNFLENSQKSTFLISDKNIIINLNPRLNLLQKKPSEDQHLDQKC